MIRRLGVALAIALTIALAPPTHADTLLRLGVSQRSVGALPVVLAERRGLFTAEGIRLETLDFDGGGPAVQALASRSVDLCVCAPDHAVRLHSRGLHGAILVALQDRHVYALIAATDAAPDLRALRGRRVGITSPGSLTDNTMRFAIAQLGLNPDTDYQLINIGTGGPMRAALDTGAIAAGMFTTPDVQTMLAVPGHRVVQDFRTLDYPALDLVVVGAWLSRNEPAARAVARAVVAAERLAQTDPAAVRDAIHALFPTLTPPIIEAVAHDQVEGGGMSRDGRVRETGYATMLDMLRIADPSIRPAPYRDVVATQYLPATP